MRLFIARAKTINRKSEYLDFISMGRTGGVAGSLNDVNSVPVLVDFVLKKHGV